MEMVKEFLLLKSFNRYSFFLVIGSLVTAIILLGAVADIETSEQKYGFSCRIKGENKDFFQKICFVDYQAKTTRGFPLYGFVLLYFISVTLVSLLYSLSVKAKIEDIESQDQEMIQPNRSAGLYRRYCIQLAIRFFIGMIFLILQWGVFYPLHFPFEHACDLTHTHQAKVVNTTSGAGNATRVWYDCHNPQACTKTVWTILVFIVIVLITFFILVELIYVVRKAKVNENFQKDLEFFKIHLLNKSRRVVENFLAKMKENIKKSTMFYEPLLPNIPGEERKLLELDQIYTNLIMYPGRTEYKFTGERHEIVEGYLKSQEQHKSIDKLEEMFAPKPGNQQERPLSIMIIGRPGIGKSLLCLKILRDWACGKTFNEETQTGKRFQFVCLFKLRHFNNDETMNLQQLLRRGQFSAAFPKEVYDWILSHPEKVLLIFDGLDEFGKKENILREQEFESSLQEKIPFTALYAKLTLGKLLPGATVVTTTRPTALLYVSFPDKTFDRSLEILGFTKEEIETYVERFCQASNIPVKDKIWNHISSNGNLLSLCYIPVTCRILCFSFQERLKQNECNAVDYYLPTTLTEIYEDALMIIIVCKHNPEYRNNVPEQQKLLSSFDFAPEVKKSLKSLGEVAYKGIEEDRLIFETNEVKGHEESGLLHRLPNKQVGMIQYKEQYCFLHLTIQEFLAAKNIVAKLKENNLRDLQSWISDHLHQGKWEVVMQFVAGLLHDEDNSKTRIFIESLPQPATGHDEAPWPSVFGEKELALRLFKYIFEISRNSDNGWRELVRDKLSGVVNVGLSDSSLTDADLTSIAFVLQEAKNIASLNVSNNHITSMGCLEIRKLLKMLGSSDPHYSNECKLTKLAISRNKIGDDGVRLLSGVLSKNECKLTTLDISNNEIGDDGVSLLSGVLSKNECKLTTLDISGNKISDDGVKYLSDALATNECKLTTLDISAYFGRRDDGFKHLFDALSKKKCKLTTLGISCSQIGKDEEIHLGNALFKNECKLLMLRNKGFDIPADLLNDFFTLNACCTKISADLLKYFSSSLSSDECKLTTLNIRCTKISADLLKYFSSALSSDECKLTTLNIRCTEIPADLLKHLPAALSTLNICATVIAKNGLKPLCDALSSHECKLTTLDIHAITIEDDGWLKRLSDALKKCKLTILDIKDNGIRAGACDVEHLPDAVSSMECKLTTLNIDATYIE